MLLKRLELQGFKSFADKTSLDLSSKIVAVVGPNGSGKSNVTDAIRWLLGERDARNLRGGKVDDLIFAGNDKRARVGLAQATLHFDNSSGFFPVDYNEVSISRRVSRDGESLFFINKSEVRLKDVVDFFAKAKLGARGLTIINQGSSDMFIKATPIERREMIEEILGLKEYQLKKAESLRKLKNTETNLALCESSLEELKPHLRFLKRQVARYEGRDEMLKELAELENGFYGRRLNSLDSEIKEHATRLVGFDERIKEVETARVGLEAEFQKVKDSEPDATKEYAALEEAKSELLRKKAVLQKDLGRLEAQLEFQSTPSSGGDLAKLVSEVRALAASGLEEGSLDALRAKISEIISKIDSALNPEKPAKQDAESAKFKEAITDLSGKLKSIDEELAELGKKEESVRGILGGFNKDFSAAYELLEDAKKKESALHEEKNRLLFAIEKAQVRREGIVEELKQIGRSPESFSGSAELGMSEEDAMKRMFKLRGDLAAIGEVDENLIKEAAEAEERFNFLSGQTEDLAIAMRDLRILIKELDEKIHKDFISAISKINAEFEKLMKLTFGGGKAKLVIKDMNTDKANLEEEESDSVKGIEIEVSLPRKRVSGLDVLSGGERTLVSIAVIFALVSVSPPPFLVLDEIDAALDEGNARRFSQILKEFSKHTQFVVITHNRATMEAADVLYGVTMGSDGTSKLLSLKLSDAQQVESVEK